MPLLRQSKLTPVGRSKLPSEKGKEKPYWIGYKSYFLFKSKNKKLSSLCPIIR